MLRDLDGMLVQFLVFAVCCCVCVAACNSVYILLVPGNEDHQWLMEFRCHIGGRLQILWIAVQSY